MKKGPMQPDDFDRLLAETQSTKVIRISNFDEENDIPKQVKKRDSIDAILESPTPKSDTQELIDFLRAGPPAGFNSDPNIKKSVNVDAARLERMPVPPRDASTIANDHVLQQNTGFNANFINVPNQPRNANISRNNSNRVTFSERISHLTIDQDVQSNSSFNDDERESFKPVITSRQSSLKNLQNAAINSPISPLVSPGTHLSFNQQIHSPVSNPTANHMNHSSNHSGESEEDSFAIPPRQTSIPVNMTRIVTSIPTEKIPPLNPSMSKEMLKSVDNDTIADQRVPDLNMNDHKILDRDYEQDYIPADYVNSVYETAHKKSDHEMRSMKFNVDNEKDEHINHLIDANKQALYEIESLKQALRQAQSLEQEHKSKIDFLQEANQSALLEIESLKQALSSSRQETEHQMQKMEEQKAGFDKLSAQAYKKIKDLLTEKTILNIEITTLRTQMDEMEAQYQAWAGQE